MNIITLEQIISLGEFETIEFERSTAELRRAGETLCAFLNGDGGQVLVGVGPKGQLVCQQVADIKLRNGSKPPQAVPSSSHVELLSQATEPSALAELMAVAGHSSRTRFGDDVLRAASRRGPPRDECARQAGEPETAIPNDLQGARSDDARGHPVSPPLFIGRHLPSGLASRALGAWNAMRFSVLEIAMQLCLSPAHHDGVPDEEFSSEDVDLAIAMTAALLRLAPRWGADATASASKESAP